MCSITAEKAAKPPQPNAAAAGPPEGEETIRIEKNVRKDETQLHEKVGIRN